LVFYFLTDNILLGNCIHFLKEGFVFLTFGAEIWWAENLVGALANWFVRLTAMPAVSVPIPGKPSTYCAKVGSCVVCTLVNGDGCPGKVAEVC